MCLVVFAYRFAPDYELVFAGNRDEFYDRPTAPARYWDGAPGILGGRDLVGGGTWLGITRSGRFALVTNFRDPLERLDARRSRGLLASEFLGSDTHPHDFLEQLAAGGPAYRGYNLVVGASGEYYHYSNRAGTAPRRLTPGIYGLSNHLLDTSWPKVEAARESLRRLLAGGVAPDSASLMAILGDRSRPADHELPDTGVGIAWERILSARFVVSPTYGTRCSTAILWGCDGRVEFTERTFEPVDGTSRDLRFVLEIEGMCGTGH